MSRLILGVDRVACHWLIVSGSLCRIVSPDHRACPVIGSHRMGRDIGNVRHERIGREIGRNRALLFSEAIA